MWIPLWPSSMQKEMFCSKGSLCTGFASRKMSKLVLVAEPDGLNG